ncbi:uncharacterized protein LACBIDRAFT_325117 [Laccaria bicolor S238N-H82]|uniref:Predicted protein n=1 Tax=Laccaria bicolor (strain S238N-H82 / ATCC MYA-4686) TaxID=486041 RepID=B0D576_LACBS|nr:uncharacterized protein LACBIDRAFT_325117 [Laccaria bicolor S238N-H82]EDR10468.1 predicted protein [Laccaria bicolor S238N-H82]|eukprot:XP_001878918.1 predicted protein [Laccaria bicolor S238N-H82]
MVQEPHFWLIWVTKGACIGALATQIMEFFHCFADEVEYIWQFVNPLSPQHHSPFIHSSSGRISFVTYLYAWSRYFPLIAQIVNLVFMEIAQSPSAHDHTCLMGFITKAVTAQIATTCVELILLVRVHALYNRSRKSGILLGLVFITGFALEVTSDIRVIKSVIDSPNNICMPPPYERLALALFAAGVGLVQSTLLFMTVSKVILGRKLGWGRTPLVSLMLRDGVIVFALLIGEHYDRYPFSRVLSSSQVVVTLIITFEIAQNMEVLKWNAIFSWYVSLLSIVGCRVIMNMRRLGPQHQRSSDVSELQQFTSVFYSDSDQLAYLTSLSH